MEFRIIFSLQYSMSINTFEVDLPSDSLHNAFIVKPKNTLPASSPKAVACCKKLFYITNLRNVRIGCHTPVEIATSLFIFIEQSDLIINCDNTYSLTRP